MEPPRRDAETVDQQAEETAEQLAPWAEVTVDHVDIRRDAETEDGAPVEELQGPPELKALGSRFAVQEELGRGGMGVVYKARDLAADRDVALKVSRGRRLAADQVERFRREGQIAAGLDHPGIVRVHSAGVEDGVPYLVYELVEGARTLSEVWDELDLNGRLRVVGEAASALGYAHARGVVHRDVKPANLLVDHKGRVRVTDFGLALARSLERLTRTGVSMGTPGFMAPEQVSGRRDELGPATDVWALGVILFFALTDRLPFEGDNPAEVAQQIVEAQPAPLLAAAPPALRELCLRCLRADPDQRLPHATAFRDGLDAARGDPVRLGRLPILAAGAALLLAVALYVTLAESLSGPTPPVVTGQAPPADTDHVANLEAVLPLRRLEAVETWLAENPDARVAPEVRDLRERLLERPLLRLEHRRLAGARAAGERVFTWATEPAVRVWSLRTGRLEAEWSTPLPPRDVRPLDDGRVVVACGREVEVRDASGATTQSWRLPGEIHCLAVSQDQARLAMGGDWQSARIVSLESGELLLELEPHAGAVEAVTFSPAGDAIITACGGVLRVLPLINDLRSYRLNMLGSPRVLETSSRGLVGVGDAEGYLSLYDSVYGRRPVLDAAEHESSGRTPEHPGGVADLAFTRDGRWMVSAPAEEKQEGGGVVLWDLLERRRVGRLPTTAYGERFVSVEVVEDGSGVVVGRGSTGVAEVWSFAAFRHGSAPSQPGRVLEALHALQNPRERLRTAQRWLRDHGAEHPRAAEVRGIIQDILERPLFVLEHPAVEDATFLERNVVATYSGEGQVYTWDLWNGNRIRGHRFRRGLKTCAADSTSRSFVIAENRGRLTLKQMRLGIRHHEVELGFTVSAVAYSLGGDRLAAGGEDSHVRVFEFKESEPRQLAVTLGPHRSEVQVLRWLSRSRLLSGCGDYHNLGNFLHLWDVDTGRLIWKVTLQGPPTVLEPCPDGQSVLVAGSSGLAEVLSLDDGRLLGTLSARDDMTRLTGITDLTHLGSLGGMAFVSPTLLLSSSKARIHASSELGPRSNDLRLWAFPSRKLLGRFRSKSSERFMSVRVTPERDLFLVTCAERGAVEVWSTDSLIEGGFR